MDEHITYQVDETPKDEELDLSHFLSEFENLHHFNENDDFFAEIKNYDLNYSIKQLLLICEYYGISKGIKMNKMKKSDTIEQIVLFENDATNYEMVQKRKKMWHYINVLKDDKFMKKYVLW